MKVDFYIKIVCKDIVLELLLWIYFENSYWILHCNHHPVHPCLFAEKKNSLPNYVPYKIYYELLNEIESFLFDVL